MTSFHAKWTSVENGPAAASAARVWRHWFAEYAAVKSVPDTCDVSLPCPVYERRRLYERTVDTSLYLPLGGLLPPGSSWSIVWCRKPLFSLATLSSLSRHSAKHPIHSTLSQKKLRKRIFLSELCQISTDRENFWHKDSKENKLFWGVLT